MESASSSKNITGDDNVFEISDFTVVTDLEVLIATLENAIQEMKAEVGVSGEEDEKTDNTTSNTDGRICRTSSKKFEYRNYVFQMDYLQQSKYESTNNDDFRKKFEYLSDAALSLISPEIDFFEETNIWRQYGISSDFFLIYPVGKNNYMTESTVNMIQSAVNVASLSTECDLPIFIQFAHGASIGVLQNRNFVTNFEGAVLNKCMSRQKYLDGILDMFKQKFNSSLGAGQKIKVSLQHDFRKKLGSENLDDSEPSPRKRYCQHKYPFQSVDSALIKEIQMSAVWMNLEEHYLAETDNFSNIDPENAHKWKISVKFDDEFSFEQSYLFNRLFELTEEEFAGCTVKSQLPPSTDVSSLGTAAFGPLINKPVVLYIDIIGIGGGPSNVETLSHCIKFIMSKSEMEEYHLTSSQEKLLKKLENTKAAPAGSLTRRLATCLVSKIDGNFVGFCRMWIKFLEILRHHWEYNQDLPGFSEDEKPDIGYCLLHQKLQMIHYCISMKKKKHQELEANKLNMESGEKEQVGWATSQKSDTALTLSTTDEEFFDANEAFHVADEQQDPDMASTSKERKPPRGRSNPLDAFLKNYPTEQIYAPITQDQGPMTEDQIEKRESYLVSLEDAETRTRAQSELLLSDMQAFKAANPGCVIEDFLQWHSPRDMIEGELSDRMKLPGNLWKETWDSARAVPASQQVRLFNETREVEQILQHFANLRVREIAELLLPIACVQMSEALIKNATNCLNLVQPTLEKLCGEINLATKTGEVDEYFDCGHSLRLAEELIMKYSTTTALLLGQAEKAHLTEELELSLLDAFVTNICKSNPLNIDELWLKNEQSICEVPDAPYGPIFGVLRNFMMESEEEEDGGDTDERKKEWPAVIRKQTILRRVVPHPGNGSRPMPQRMYTSYREGEFIFCRSLTSDITFM